jgi:hypothetical protein
VAKRKRSNWIGLTKGQKSSATRRYNKLRKAGRSEAYSKRVARAEAKGKSRQQARGHKPKEHIERRAKEVERYGITTDQIRRIRAWYHVFNDREYKGVPSESETIEYAQDNGYKAWTVWRDTWNDVRAKYLAAMKRGELIDGNLTAEGYSYLVSLTTQAGVRPSGDEQWLYYH